MQGAGRPYSCRVTLDHQFLHEISLHQGANFRHTLHSDKMNPQHKKDASSERTPSAQGSSLMNKLMTPSPSLVSSAVGVISCLPQCLSSRDTGESKWCYTMWHTHCTEIPDPGSFRNMSTLNQQHTLLAVFLVCYKHTSIFYPSNWKFNTLCTWILQPTWQFGERRSQSRIVLSRDPEIKVSSTGDIERATTLQYRNTHASEANQVNGATPTPTVVRKRRIEQNKKHHETSVMELKLITILISISLVLSPSHISPFCVPWEIPNVFVVMQGEVSDCVWNINKPHALLHHQPKVIWKWSHSNLLPRETVISPQCLSWII